MNELKIGDYVEVFEHTEVRSRNGTPRPKNKVGTKWDVITHYTAVRGNIKRLRNEGAADITLGDGTVLHHVALESCVLCERQKAIF